MTQTLKRQFWEGLIISGLGAGILALIPSQVDVIPGMETDMSPSFIPVVMSVLLVVVGIVLVAGSLLGKGNEKSPGLERSEFLRVLFSGFLLLFYAVVFPKIGFVVTSAVFIGIFSYIFGQRNPVKLAAVMLVIPVLVWILFEIVFVIPLPHGLIF